MAASTPLFFSFLLLLLSSSFAQPQVEDEKEFSYNPKSEDGPNHWGELHEEWASCGNGTMQSPINILKEDVIVAPFLRKLDRSYKAANTTLVNRGHDVELKWDGDAGYITLNGTRYNAQQAHWHSPSEHTISGRRFVLELHMVHQSEDQKFAVVAILFKIGSPDSFLEIFEKQLEIIANRGVNSTSAGVISPKDMKMGSRKYYRYNGSLTTPPCTEGVTWTILNKVRTVSRKQLSLFHEALRDKAEMNARPLQKNNGRPIYGYRPMRWTESGSK